MSLHAISSITITACLVSSVFKYQQTNVKRKQIEEYKLELDNLEKLLDTKSTLYGSRSEPRNEFDNQVPKKIVFDCPTVEDLVALKIKNYERKSKNFVVSEKLKPEKSKPEKTKSGKTINESQRVYKSLAQPPIPPILPDLPPIVKDYSKINDFNLEWKNRLERHEKVCKLFPEKKPIFEEWLSGGPDKQLDSYSLVDVKHKVVYCELPKCGCTNWKTTMRKMMELKVVEKGAVFEESGWWNYTKKNGRKKRGSKSVDSEIVDEIVDESFDEKRAGIENRSKRSPLAPGSIDSVSNAISEAMKEYENSENQSEIKREAALKSAYDAYKNWYKESTRSKPKYDVLEHDFTSEEKVNIYSNGTYFRFLFVRHPLERLLSGYRNKIQPLFLNRPMLGGIWSEVSMLEKSELSDLKLANSKLDKYKELDVHGFHAFLHCVQN